MLRGRECAVKTEGRIPFGCAEIAEPELKMIHQLE